jgi:hypothetical protein
MATTTAPQTQTTSSSDPQMSFPSDIGTYGRYISISAYSYSRENRGAEARKGPYKGHVILPVPEGLGVGYAASWGPEALGLPGLAGAYALNSTLGTGGLQDQLSKINREGGGIQDQINVVNDWINAGVSKFNENLPGAATASALDMFRQSAGAGLGVFQNPHMAVLFNGVGFRQFSFKYDFVARNQQESDTLKAIINFFKTSMSPSFVDTTNHLFKYPDEFDLILTPNDYYFLFAPCVLTNFGVNYHSSGVPLFFEKTKAPVHVSLALDFMETQIVTREDIQGGVVT